MLMCNQPVATMKKTELGKAKEVVKCSEETCYVLRCILTACTAGSFHSVSFHFEADLKVPDEAIFAEIHKSYFLRAFFSAAFNVPLKGECKEAL